MMPLDEVVFDIRARNGEWCMAPYPGHPRGCPNYPACVKEHPNFKTLPPRKWFALVEDFDLKAHAEKMKAAHPDWTERQARCVLYWQNGVRKRLSEKALKEYRPLEGDILLTIPEACGVNVFATMAQHGLILKKNPDVVHKIMLIGKIGGNKDG